MDHSLENRIRERAYEIWASHGYVHRPSRSALAPPRTLRGPAKAAHHTRDASTRSAAISTLSGRHGLYLGFATDVAR